MEKQNAERKLEAAKILEEIPKSIEKLVRLFVDVRKLKGKEGVNGTAKCDTFKQKEGKFLVILEELQSLVQMLMQLEIQNPENAYTGKNSIHFRYDISFAETPNSVHCKWKLTIFELKPQENAMNFQEN